LKQDLAMYAGWPQTYSPPASASQVLALQVCTTTQRKRKFC
jgi:hypothetical protein